MYKAFADELTKIALSAAAGGALLGAGWGGLMGAVLPVASPSEKVDAVEGWFRDQPRWKRAVVGALLGGGTGALMGHGAYKLTSRGA